MMRTRSLARMIAMLLAAGVMIAADAAPLSLPTLFTPQFKGWHALGDADKPVIVALDTIDNKTGCQFAGNLAKTPDRFTWRTDALWLDLSAPGPVALSMYVRNLKAVAEIALEFQAGEGTYVFRVPASKLEETWNDIALKPADLVKQGRPDALDKITQVRVHLTKKLDQSASVVICAGSTDADLINQSAMPR